MSRLPLIVMVVVLAGCETSREPESRGPSQWNLGATPSLVVGLDAQQPGHELYRVVGAARLSDGRLAIANAGSSEIRFFYPDGSLQMVAGREGRGPGEFVGIQNMVWSRGDTLLVLAWSPGLTWVDPNGVVVREERIDYSAASVPCMLYEGGIAPLANGRLLMRYESNRGARGCEPVLDDLRQDDGLVALYDWETETLDTLIALPGTERNGRLYRAYGRLIVAATSPDVIAVAETGGDSVYLFDANGGAVLSIPMPFAARPVPAAARSEPVRRRQRPDGTEQIGEPYAYPSHYPRIGRIVVDRTNLVWAMAYPAVDRPVSSWTITMPGYFQVSPGPFEWRILTEVGEVLASIVTPTGLFPLEIGEDYLVGLRKTELDVESVVVHGLDRNLR